MVDVWFSGFGGFRVDFKIFALGGLRVNGSGLQGSRTFMVAGFRARWFKLSGFMV